jgi:preprotein translocase subunit SecD
VVLTVALLSLVNQSFDVNILGQHLKRGGDAFLGMKLGLDLQGGSHLVYQARGVNELTVTFGSAPNLSDVREAIADAGKPNAGLEQGGGTTVVITVDTLRPAELDVEGEIARESDEAVIRQALEGQVGPILTLDVVEIQAEPTREQMEGVMDIIVRRVNPAGVVEPVIQLMDQNRVMVQLPGVDNVEDLKRLIGQTARLEFKERICLASGSTALPTGGSGDLCDLPENQQDSDVGLTGDDLARAFPGTDNTGRPVVNLQFKSRGTQAFAELTNRLYGTVNRFVILLDGEEIIDPVVRSPINTGSAIIQGPTFTLESVRTISIQLESGRLPIPLELVQETGVDAILGAESLRKSLVAGIVGLGLVLLFMVLYYRAPGLVAAITLVMYTAILLSIFKLWPVTLTLAGIAAFILSIGMVVDANILIFERMKEELRLGRTLASAIENGFNRAWPSIRDSNTSTLITCAILFWFGQRLGASLVSGFAATLAIGVIVSLFSAIVTSKTLLELMNATPLGRRRSWFSPETLAGPPRPAAAGAAEADGSDD